MKIDISVDWLQSERGMLPVNVVSSNHRYLSFVKFEKEEGILPVNSVPPNVNEVS